MSIELFKQLYEATLEMVETTFTISQEFDMVNSQEFLEYQDKLNAFSVI